MKKIILSGVVSLLLLSGVAFAVQSEEQKGGSSMRGMMDQMKKEEKGMEGMSGMEEMKGMMKMMDQCSAMMESAKADSDRAKESQKK